MDIKEFVRESIFEAIEVKDVTVKSSGEPDDMYSVTVTLPNGEEQEIAADLNQDEANKIKLAIQQDESPDYKLQAAGE